jgi:hypothetical protein
MRRIAAALIGALCLVRGVAAQPPPPAQAPPRAVPPRAAPPKASTPKDAAAPDLDFLEYLGSWQGNDDEWIAIKEWDQDGAPQGKSPDAGKPPAPPAKPNEPVPQQAGNDHEKSR